jgi:hypothetical protein
MYCDWEVMHAWRKESGYTWGKKTRIALKHILSFQILILLFLHSVSAYSRFQIKFVFIPYIDND